MVSYKMGGFLVALLSLVYSETCKCISLAGGGSHGAYEAGAVYTLATNLPA